MMIEVNAMGKVCPIPVIMTKKVLRENTAGENMFSPAVFSRNTFFVIMTGMGHTLPIAFTSIIISLHKNLLQEL